MINKLENNKNIKRIYLSEKNKKIYGVCGGVGEAFDVDPTLIRIAVIFVAFITAVFPAVFAYLMTVWFIMPHKPKEK
ncbi:MAG: PspC domain-containing protein [Patescibacteria group bacterium]